jgi:hypothetical protein
MSAMTESFRMCQGDEWTSKTACLIACETLRGIARPPAMLPISLMQTTHPNSTSQSIVPKSNDVEMLKEYKRVVIRSREQPTQPKSLSKYIYPVLIHFIPTHPNSK